MPHILLKVAKIHKIANAGAKTTNVWCVVDADPLMCTTVYIQLFVISLFTS